MILIFGNKAYFLKKNFLIFFCHAPYKNTASPLRVQLYKTYVLKYMPSGMRKTKNMTIPEDPSYNLDLKIQKSFSFQTNILQLLLKIKLILHRIKTTFSNQFECLYFSCFLYRYMYVICKNSVY